MRYRKKIKRDWKKSDRERPYVDVKGTLKYSDFSGSTYKNDVLLNLGGLSGQLQHKKESIKRDHEIINASKSIKSISKDIRCIKNKFNNI